MNLLTVEQVAAKLRRNPQLVRRWIREGRLRATRVGPLWVVSIDELRFDEKGLILPVRITTSGVPPDPLE